jgi:hexosaminidase
MIGKTSKTIVFLFLWMGTASSFSYGNNGISTPPAEAAKIAVSWRFITNNYNNEAKFLASLTLVNNGRQMIPKSGWKLYFSLRYHGINLQSNNSDLPITHVSGDLFYIAPISTFAGLNAGQSAKIDYTGRGLVANYQDVPSGFFLVDNVDNKPHPISLGHVDPGTLKGADAKDIFEQNKDVTDIPVSKLPAILPSPTSFKKEQGSFVLDNQVEIITDESFKKEAAYLSQEIQSLTGNQLSITTKKKKIIFQKNKLPEEVYDLIITPDNITIAASSGAGIFYGIQSLKNLMPAGIWSGKHSTIVVPCITIHDAPRIPVRAFMLDVSRNFKSKQEILKLLDVMALYKLNTFHFHFIDDEGWRIQIPGLPELTAIGSQRGYPFDRDQRLHPSYGSGPTTADKMGSGYYSRADFIELLKYAQMRHIRVIPEIESPGHARAAVRSMLARYQKYMKLGDRHKAEEYLLTDLKDSSKYVSAQYFSDNIMNPALPSTYRFVEKVINELVSMYKEAGADLTMIHMGGDEVPNGTWERSPAIQKLMKTDTSIHDINRVFQNYFSRVKKMLNKHGLNLYAWEELTIGTQKNENSRRVIKIPDFVKDNVSVDAWYNVQGNESIPYEAANAGYKTVLTCLDFFYFDMSYRRSFYEPGDEWLGFLDVKKVLSFIPYDYYRNSTIDYAGRPFPVGYFNGKLQLTSAGRKNITGIQGALWGENIRSSNQMEYMILPRLLALADKAWAKEPQWEMETDTAKSARIYDQYWNTFANQLGKKELRKLTAYHNGYHFRIPAAGIKEVNGAVQANQQYPGMTIRYTTDGTEPKNTSPVYSRPIKLKGKIKMRIFDAKGRGGEPTSLTIN